MAIQSIGGGVINAGYRVDRLQDRVTNTAKASVGTAAVVAATGAGVYALSKVKPQTYGKILSPITKGIRNVAAKVLKSVGNKKGIINKTVSFIAKGAGKVAEALKNNPKTAVIGAAIAAGAVALNGVLNHKAYNDGRIDQKYDDRAALQAICVDA